MKNVASNKYLDVAGAQDAVGANIIQLENSPEDSARSSDPGDDSRPGISLIDSEDMPIESRLSDDNGMNMGDFLDYLEENDGYNPNIQPRLLVDPLFDSTFKTGPLFQLITHNNFNISNTPTCYFAYATQGPTKIRHTQILVLDLIYTREGNNLSFQVEVRNAGWVAYNSKTDSLKLYKVHPTGINNIQIVSAKSYFKSMDTEGAFNYRKYDSYRGGWLWNTSKLQTAVVGWAAYALGVGWLGPLNTSLTALEKSDRKEGKPYYYDETKALQQQRNRGRYIAEVNATWGGTCNYFFKPGDYWVLETRKNNMRKWAVGFVIDARIDVYPD